MGQVRLTPPPGCQTGRESGAAQSPGTAQPQSPRARSAGHTASCTIQACHQYKHACSICATWTSAADQKAPHCPQLAAHVKPPHPCSTRYAHDNAYAVNSFGACFGSPRSCLPAAHVSELLGLLKARIPRELNQNLVGHCSRKQALTDTTCTRMLRKEMPPRSVPEPPLSNTPRQYAPASPVCMNK